MYCRTITFAFTAAIALTAVSAAHAQKFKEFDEKCGAGPYGPDVKLDAAITDEQMAELRKDIVDFLKASDEYQDCVMKTAELGPKLDKEDSREKHEEIKQRFGREAMKRLDESQSEKQRVGNDFNRLVDLRKKGAPK